MRASVAVALSAAATALTGGFLAGTEPAGATTAPTGSIVATSSPPVPSTGHDLPAGSLTITLSATGPLPTGTTLALGLSPSVGASVIDWNTYTVSSHTISVTAVGGAGTKLDIVLGPKSSGTSAVIHVSQITYTTNGAAGEVDVTAHMSNGVTFSPSTAVNGTIVQTPPNAPTISISSHSQPKIALGTADAAAGDWTVAMSGDSGTGSGWTAGAVLTVSVAPPSGTNCAGSGYLYFAGTPTVTLGTVTGTTATPAVSASLLGSGSCGASQPNELLLTFGNSVYFDTASTGAVGLTIGGVRYAVGTTASATGTGSVEVSASFSATPSSVDTSGASNANVEAAPTPVATSPTPVSTSPPPVSTSPAQATTLVVKADTPPVTVVQDAYDAPISEVDVLGSVSMPVPVGYVCLSLSAGTFNTAATPSVGVPSGNGSASPNAMYEDEGTTGAGAIEFQVLEASTSGGGYSVSGLAVNAPTATGAVAVKATFGSSADCASDAGQAGSARAFTVAATPVTRIYGQTPDATAAAELEHQFDAQATACPGRPGDRPVVLAMDSRYPDALSSAYLAGSLGTGELLTPTDSLSAAAQDAIQLEGITQVYIVGGPLAVSPAVASQVESMLAYNCGGKTPLTSAGPVHIQVTRIAGATEYDTAQWVAEYPTPAAVGSLDVAGAFGGTDRTGGSGRYNDTAGNGSPAPATSSALPTAIVATGHTFQDAESASVLSYAERLPILLTTTGALSPQVSSAIGDLGIKQVIVMGGQLAVSDAAVSSLEALGVSVLRVAGDTATGTAAQLADFEMGTSAGHLGAGWTGSGGVAVARGDYFTDGLAGAVVAAGAGRSHTHQPEPLVLCTSPTVLGQPLSAFLAAAGRTGIDGNPADRVAALTILGGPDAVSPSVVTTMTRDL